MSERPPPSPGASGAGDTDSCPSEAELAAFTEGGLGRERRMEVALHALRCTECKDVLATVAAHREEIERERPASPQRWAVLAAGVLLAAALGWAGLAWWRSQGPGASSEERAGIAALVEATGERRLVEARLSGGFAWAPVEVTRGAGDGATAEDRWEIAGVAARLREESNADAHALGVAHLLLGNAEEAIERLEVAAEDEPENPVVLADLAAALIERGKQPERAQDLVRALDCAERALAIAPSSPEARFNKALAVEELGLREAAIAAWEDYLKVDSDSAWAREARERAERLRSVPLGRRWEEDAAAFEEACARGDASKVEELVRRHPQDATEAVWREFGEWADLVVAGDGSASAAARAVEIGAGGVTRVLRDLLLEKAGAEIRAAESSRERTLQLARAHRLLRDGRSAQDGLAPERANGLLTQARDVFAELRSPCRDVADLYRLSSAYYRHRPEVLLPDLEDLIGRLGEDRRLVRGRAQWLRALTLLAAGRKSAALASVAEARRDLDAIGFTADSVFVRSLAASTWWLLGQYARSWTEYRVVFSRLDDVTDPRRAQALLGAGAFEANVEGLGRAAVVLHEAALTFARRHASAPDRCDAIVWLARTAQVAGDTEVARAALEEGRSALAAVGDATLRTRFASELDIVEGFLHLQEAPQQSISLLDRALAGTMQADRLLEIHFARARAKERSGDAEGASADYLRALELAEGQRNSADDPYARITLFDTVADLAREIVRFEIGRSDSGRALAIADRVRGVSFRGPGSADNDVVRAVQRRLGRQDAVVFFAVLEEQAWAWVVRAESIHLTAIAVSRSDLQRSVDAWRQAVFSGPVGKMDRAGSVLFDTLVAPLRAHLQGARRIAIVSDGALHRLSWGSLPDPRSGRRWGEEVALAVAPTLRALAARREERRDMGRLGALIVGNPTLDRASRPDLPDLAGAGREASRIAGLYASASVLTAQQATPERVLEGSARASILHIGAHALTHEADPALSTIVLAPGGSLAPDGGWMAEDIRGHDMRGLRLVVLAACRSGDGPVSRMEGPLSLARPFLENGARSVVVSLWDYPDETGAAVTEELHRSVAAGREPMEALRAAVNACWRGPRPDPRACGGLQLILNEPMGG